LEFDVAAFEDLAWWIQQDHNKAKERSECWLADITIREEP